MSTAAIDIRHAEKTYRGKVRALRGVQLRVEPGEVYGLLGPNGAGKSTLVKILMTMIRASRCEGTVLGKPVGHKATLARVGYLPEHHRFPDYLTGAQVCSFFGALSGITRAERKKRIGELLELVGMTRWAGTKIKKYSKGMRQRIGLAQALVNDPDLVLLDEPTDGVDPVGRRDIRGIVQRIRDEGKTVFVNSHLLSELEMVCDRVAIMVHGQVRQQGTLDELTRDQRVYEIETDRESLSDETREVILNAVAPGVTAVFDGPTIRLNDEAATPAQPVLDAVRARGLEIRRCGAKRPSLEDLFMSAVGDDDSPGAVTGREPKRPTPQPQSHES
ncbi:MAG: ABC transporter ATP-binding protein [Planctomycetota bacterium]